MKADEIEIYAENLIRYSSIIRLQAGDREEILDCIKTFEYFEDYEKCSDLLEILDNIDRINKKNNITHIG